MNGLFSLPIVFDPMLDLFMVSFGCWFCPFFLSQSVFSADGRPPGLISLPFSESSVVAVKDLIVCLDFNFFDIVADHFHPRAFHPLFLDHFKGFNFNQFIFIGSIRLGHNF